MTLSLCTCTAALVLLLAGDECGGNTTEAPLRSVPAVLLFFRPLPLSFRQVDQHAVAYILLINAVGKLCLPSWCKDRSKSPCQVRTRYTVLWGRLNAKSQRKRTRQKHKQTKTTTKQPHKKRTNNNRPRKNKTAKGHIDPAGTVERMMSYASSDGLVWRNESKQTNKTKT